MSEKMVTLDNLETLVNNIEAEIDESRELISAVADNDSNLGADVRLTVDALTYIVTLSLVNQNNQVLGSASIDLPIESMVIGGDYDADTKSIVLSLQSGETVDVPVADLVEGLVSTDDLAITISQLASDRFIGKHLYGISNDASDSAAPPSSKLAFNNTVHIGDECITYRLGMPSQIVNVFKAKYVAPDYDYIWWTPSDMYQFMRGSGLVLIRDQQATNTSLNNWETIKTVNRGNSGTDNLVDVENLNLSGYSSIRILFNAGKPSGSSSVSMNLTLYNSSGNYDVYYSGASMVASQVNTWEIDIDNDNVPSLYNGSAAPLLATFKKISGPYGYGELQTNVARGHQGSRISYVSQIKRISISTGDWYTNSGEDVYVIIQGRRF